MSELSLIHSPQSENNELLYILMRIVYEIVINLGNEYSMIIF